MNSKELFRQALAYSTRAMQMVGQGDYDKQTPDTEWDVETLACHMLYELCWTADILKGATVEEVGEKYDGDLIGSDLLGSWQQAAEAALNALETCDTTAIAHLSYGDVTNDYYLREAASDQLIHAWDLSAALGQPVHYDESLARAVYEEALPKRPALKSSGLFGDPIMVPESTDIQTKLLALYGRYARWKAPQQESMFKK